MEWPQDAPHTPVVSAKTLPRDWRTDETFVYIGLPGYGDGQPKLGHGGAPGWDTGCPFGKPWLTLKDERGWRYGYRDYLVSSIEADPVFAGAVAALHGYTLVCWCKHKRPDQWCHGDLLAHAAERLYHSLEG